MTKFSQNFQSLLTSVLIGLVLLVTTALYGQTAKEPAAKSPATPPKAAPAPSKTAPVGEVIDTAAEAAGHGLLGPLRIGPTASVGFPFLLNYGLDATWDRTFGVAVAGGRMRRDLDKNSELEIFNFDVRARWFPWQGSFFLGAAFGNLGLVGLAESDVKTQSNDMELTIPTQVRLEVNSKYLTPHLGWFATWDSGFTLGFELGYQIPINSKSEIQTAFRNASASAETFAKNSDDYQKAKKDLETAADSFGKQAIPYLNLFRIGWLF